MTVIGSTPRTFADTDNTFYPIPLSSLIPSWSGAQKFSMGFWAFRKTYSDTYFHAFVRVGNKE